MEQTHNLTPKDESGKPAGPAVNWRRLDDSFSPYGSYRLTISAHENFTLHNVQELPALTLETQSHYSGVVRRYESSEGTTDYAVAGEDFLGLVQEATNFVYFRFLANREYETRETKPRKRRRVNSQPEAQPSVHEEIARLRERVAVLEHQVKEALLSAQVSRLEVSSESAEQVSGGGCDG